VTKIETPGGPSKDGSLDICFARRDEFYGTAGSVKTFVWRPHASNIFERRSVANPPIGGSAITPFLSGRSKGRCTAVAQHGASIQVFKREKI
jgi:hypothetical protein